MNELLLASQRRTACQLRWQSRDQCRARWFELASWRAELVVAAPRKQSSRIRRRRRLRRSQQGLSTITYYLCDSSRLTPRGHDAVWRPLSSPGGCERGRCYQASAARIHGSLRPLAAHNPSPLNTVVTRGRENKLEASITAQAFQYRCRAAKDEGRGHTAAQCVSANKCTGQFLSSRRASNQQDWWTTPHPRRTRTTAEDGKFTVYKHCISTEAMRFPGGVHGCRKAVTQV